MSRIVAVVGPTAVGKTKIAIDIAKEFSGEIVSCDSMQIYKYMDIGSAKPSEDERRQAGHHLIDFVDPREEFSVARYQKLAKEAIKDIFERGHLPIISGGTGLYLNSILYDMDFSFEPSDLSYRRDLEIIAQEGGKRLLHEMLCKKDPVAASEIHPNNTRKVIRALERLHEGESRVRRFRDIKKETQDYEVTLIGLTRDRAELYERINRRVDTIVDKGLENEVRYLKQLGLSEENIAMKGIGYKEMMEYINGNCSLEYAVESIKKNTRHYAKKQLTWFRRYDKMKWYNISEYVSDEEASEAVKEWLKRTN